MKRELITVTAAALLMAIMALAGCKKDEKEEKPVRVSSVSLNTSALELRVGESATLAATIAPGDARDKTVTWATSNLSIATVDDAGKVTAAGAGTATITVTTHDGSKTATATVNVKKRAAPTGLTAEAISASQIYLAWDAIPDATGYFVLWSHSPDSFTSQVGIVTETNCLYEYNIYHPQRTLYFRIVAYFADLADRSEESETVSVTMPAKPEEPPEEPTKTVTVGAQAGITTAGTAGSITYAVTTAGIENGDYEATVLNHPEGVTVGNGGIVTISSGAGTLTLNTSAATPAGVYDHMQLVINGKTSFSFRITVAEAAAKTVTVGAQAGMLTAGTAGSVTYAVTTTDIENGSYEATVANLPAGVTVGNGGKVTVSSGAGTLTLNTTAATRINEYWITLAINGATSDRFMLVVKTPGLTGFTATPQSSSEIKLAWDMVPSASGYHVQRWSGGTWQHIANVQTNLYINTGLQSNTSYNYRVRAILNNGDYSFYSDEASAVTRCETPTGLSARASSSSEIILSWNAVSGTRGYHVQMSTDGITGWTDVGAAGQNSTSYRRTGLTGCRRYYFRIHAYGNGGDSEYTAAVNATTLLDTPTGLTGEAVSLSQINLSWNAVSGASGYILQRSQLVSVNPVVVSEWENVNDYSSSTTHTDTGLNNPLRMYYYRIQAYGYAYDGASTIYSGYIDDNGDIHVLLPEK